MSYEVIIPKPVQKQLKNLPQTINEQVFARVRSPTSLRSRGSCYSVNTLKMFIKNELMLSDFLEDLKSADLVGISLNPQNLGLRLDFTC
jgi:mRNA-degrading endonuclease RelE of RelBE toxin-antitoxin system